MVSLTIALGGLIGFGGSTTLISHLTVFVLACFWATWCLECNSIPAHSLMSVTNAIRGSLL
ncbi:MAG: hypothetical protein CM1200mP30_06320 [Pseudomonadota bacterium]|nr:MAG: hypothetical protein CM1200mP30_06320 [Pseudomonadota bacterium]